MKKKLLVGLCASLLILGGLKMTEMMFGFDILPDMPAITPRQKQLKYLKEHEQEIIDFVKSQNPKIESVQIDWDSMRVGGVGTPVVTEYMLSVQGGFNNIKDTHFIVHIPLAKENDIPDIKNIFMMNHISILQNGGWYIYE